MQAGCGVGNTVLPLLEVNEQARAYACDFSPHAVSIVQSHPLHVAGRVHAFVADLTVDDLRQNVPAAAVDICTLIFVLSAIDPSKMPQVWQPHALQCQSLWPSVPLLSRCLAFHRLGPRTSLCCMLCCSISTPWELVDCGSRSICLEFLRCLMAQKSGSSILQMHLQYMTTGWYITRSINVCRLSKTLDRP